MKSIIDNNEKGSSIIELVFIFPMVLLFLITVWHFFETTADRRIQLIHSQYEAKANLRKRELQIPIIDRPCLVHPGICEERKR